MDTIIEEDHPYGFTVDCIWASHPPDSPEARGTVKFFSTIPKLAPWGTGLFDFICLGFLAFFMLQKFQWREMTRKDKIMHWVVYFLMFVSFADTVFSIVVSNYSYLANFLRPFICCAMLPDIKSNMQAVMYDMYKSVTILAMIFAFIFYFTMLGFFLFSGSFGG